MNANTTYNDSGDAVTVTADAADDQFNLLVRVDTVAVEIVLTRLDLENISDDIKEMLDL